MPRSPGWTFLSNHGHVLLQLAAGQDQTMSDIASRVGITERAVQIIVADLARDGYISVERVGRRNHAAHAGAVLGARKERPRADAGQQPSPRSTDVAGPKR